MPKKILFPLFVSLILFLPTQSHSAYVTLPPDSLSKWITSGATFDFILIDLRETSEITTVIGNPQCHPYQFAYNSGVFDNTIAVLPKNTTIILYCKSGGRSALAATKLDNAGFPSVYSLQNGFNGWTGATIASSNLMLASDLPAPSMTKTAIAYSVANVLGAKSLVLHSGSHCILANTKVEYSHLLSIYTLSGRNVLRASDPFMHGTSMYLPKNIGEGRYLVTVESLQNDKKMCFVAFF